MAAAAAQWHQAAGGGSINIIVSILRARSNGA